MNPLLENLTSNLKLRRPATSDALAEIRNQLKTQWPDDYIEFMKESNGAEGFVGEQHLVLWGVDQIHDLNSAYNIQEFFPGIVVFGSNGGEEAYGFRDDGGSASIVRLPFIGAEEDVEKVAISFSTFLEWLASRQN